LPQPDFKVDKPSGCPEHCVKFTDLTPAIAGPAQNIKWEWTLGDGSATIVNNSGISVDHCYSNSSHNQLALYDVRLVVTSDAGCKTTIDKTGYVTVFPTPKADYTIDPNPGNILTPLEYFTNNSSDFTKWWWVFGDGSPQDSVKLNPEHFYSEYTSTTYNTILMVQNQYGCKDIAYRSIEILPAFTFYIPNAFTPANGDGINDLFTGKGIGIAEYEMWIFDRWGEKVYYTNDIEKDGTEKCKASREKKNKMFILGKLELRMCLVKATNILVM